MKFYVETFGCQMNTADSREMSRRLLARGYEPSATPDEADCILLNTCTVRDHAEHKALSYLGRLAPWKNQDRRRLLVVAGCAAERWGEKLKSRFPHVDVVVGAKSIAKFDDIFSSLSDPFRLPKSPSDTLGPEGRAPRVPPKSPMGSPQGSSGNSGKRKGLSSAQTMDDKKFNATMENTGLWGDLKGMTHLLPGETSALVTIMRGCNYRCSYCIVPAVRGREVYRPAESVLAETARLAELGLSEVMLLGQTVNSYRGEGAIADFADLLRAVARVPGVRWVRFMSPHPFYVNEKFALAMAESPAVCPHMHLPVQSGSDTALARMRRNYTRAEYLRKTAVLRRHNPGISITTDFIVGFPGETEADFAATLSLVEEGEFDGAFCFKYSPRPGTESAGCPDDVPESLKEERLARLLTLTESQASRRSQNLMGAEQEVRVESAVPRAEGFRVEARTTQARKVFFTASEPPLPGTYLPVRITSIEGRTLEGVPA
jgi:tRNA-2-methylthio-N6-dimethylallyladenosine synthase